jgi:hypothetical protein
VGSIFFSVGDGAGAEDVVLVVVVVVLDGASFPPPPQAAVSAPIATMARPPATAESRRTKRDCMS